MLKQIGQGQPGGSETHTPSPPIKRYQNPKPSRTQSEFEQRASRVNKIPIWKEFHENARKTNWQNKNRNDYEANKNNFRQSKIGTSSSRNFVFDRRNLNNQTIPDKSGLRIEKLGGTLPLKFLTGSRKVLDLNQLWTFYNWHIYVWLNVKLIQKIDTTLLRIWHPTAIPLL